MERLIYYLLNKFFMNPVEKEIIKYLDNKNQIVFDVGCFRGTFTKKLIKCGYKLGTKFNFFLFDPNPNVKNYLNRLLENEKIKYFKLALDDSNSHKKFYLNNFFESSGSSLIGLVKDDKLWNRTRKTVMQILQPYKRIEDFSEINVQTETLDNFCLKEEIKSIDVLKIDTETNELNVLKGAKRLLSANKIYLIYTEISETKKKFGEKEKSVLDFLNAYNFELKKKYEIKSASFLSDLKVTDNIFVNKTFVA